MSLSATEAIDRPLIHKVVPTAYRKAGYVHLRKMSRAIFVLPVFIVGRMLKPFLHQSIIVLWISANLPQGLESLWSSGTADSISLMK
jgi:hypothetical protein